MASAVIPSWQRWASAGGAFLGWLGAGTQLALVPLTTRSATLDLCTRAGIAAPDEALLGQWFAWQTSSFLLGAACGGLLFGWMADRWGRARLLGVSILVYALFSAASAWARTPAQLLLARFVLSLGIGGTWPCGVSLVSEAWPNSSRPLLAGAMGTAANIGIFLVGLLGRAVEVTPDTWRMAMLWGALPAALGVAILLGVAEPSRWLVERHQGRADRSAWAEFCALVRPPLLRRTLVGMALGTIPLLGAWGAGKWLIPWADSVADNPQFKADTQAIWALGAVLGSAAGGWLANRFGRRSTYFAISLGSLVLNFAIFRFCAPKEPAFLPLAFVLGLVATVFFGWLPLYLPELFPTHVRATGTGLTYNVGRFASAAGVLLTGTLMRWFDGDYARVGMITSWVYGLGMLVIWFAPETHELAE